MKRNNILALLSLVGIATLPSQVALSETTANGKVGIDFFMVGDYGYVQEMAPAYLTFNAMNDIIANKSDPRNSIDFMMTMGDNLYPVDGLNPTDAEFDVMMSLFTERENLKDKTIYAVRGNHDCYFDIDKEVELGKRYSNWYMP